jgi:hypothetical protein
MQTYADAYIAAGSSGGGDPDPALYAQGSKLPLPDDWQYWTRNTVNLMLSAALGQDYVTAWQRSPTIRASSPFQKRYKLKEFPSYYIPGLMPPLDNRGAALVKAMRDGVVTALKTGQSAAVAAPVMAFWSEPENQSYRPRFQNGICYVDAQGNQLSAPQIADLQVKLLTRRVGFLLDSAKSQRR